MDIENILAEVIAISHDHVKNKTSNKEQQKWIIQTISACKLYIDNKKLDVVLERLDSIEQMMKDIDSAIYFSGD